MQKLLVPLLILAGQACSNSSGPDGGAKPTGSAVPQYPSGAKLELVYETIDVVDAKGVKTTSSTQGALTAADWQRAARPWTHLGEPYLYQEQTWDRSLGGGKSERGYRVLRSAHAPEKRKPVIPGPPEVDARLVTRMTASKAEHKAASKPERVGVMLVVRDFPEWDIPLVPPESLVSEADRANVGKERDTALETRKALFVDRARGVMKELGDEGAKVREIGWRGGWISAEVSDKTLAALIARTDLAHVELTDEGGADPQQESGAGNGFDPNPEEEFDPGTWNLGEGRIAARVNVDPFIVNGIKGAGANPNRHAYGNVTVGLNEIMAIEDEACAWYATAECAGTSRLRERIRCDAPAPPRCNPTTDFPDTDQPGTEAQPIVCCTVTPNSCAALNPAWTCTMPIGVGTCSSGRACQCLGNTCAQHATGVASILLADYTKGQASGVAVGDNAWTSGAHAPTFVNRATGMAPGASLIVWAMQNVNSVGNATDPDALAEPFAQAAARHVDILNNAWIWNEGVPPTVVTGSDCNPNAIRSFEIEAENAYDDGVFVTAAAGNNPNGAPASGRPLTECDVGSPADVPKVFAVNGLQTAAAACSARYSSCLIGPASAATGGATVKTPDGALHAGALSIIALAAPTNVEFSTVELGDRGEVDDSPTIFRFGGTSGAVAHVSGAAAVIKNHRILAEANSWINSPGRLYTFMLAMGDRHFGVALPTTQKSTGGDPSFGFGRLKLRLFAPGSIEEPYTTSHVTWSLTAASPTMSVNLNPSGFAAGTKLVKCVALQEEDMSGKDTMSQTSLSVDIGAPDPSNSCSQPTTVYSNADASFDTKKMVAVTPANVVLDGNCARATVTATQFATPTVTVHVYCYSAGIPDDCSDPQCCGAPAGTACDDHNACTTGDACTQAGVCDGSGSCADGG